MKSGGRAGREILEGTVSASRNSEVWEGLNKSRLALFSSLNNNFLSLLQNGCYVSESSYVLKAFHALYH